MQNNYLHSEGFLVKINMTLILQLTPNQLVAGCSSAVDHVTQTFFSCCQILPPLCTNVFDSHIIWIAFCHRCMTSPDPARDLVTISIFPPHGIVQAEFRRRNLRMQVRHASMQRGGRSLVGQPCAINPCIRADALAYSENSTALNCM